MHTIKVTRIGKRWHARLYVPGDSGYADEMACSNKKDIGWICREMLRWRNKLGDVTAQTSAARSRQKTGPVSKVWYRTQLQERKRCKRSM